jgi:tetratricopeptide (TPR) repeat protein
MTVAERPRFLPDAAMSPPFAFDPNAALRQAMALHQQGAVAQAGEAYRRLLGLFPDHPQLLYLAGTVELQLGRTEEGVRLLDRSLQRDPGRAEVLAHRSIGLMQLKRYGQALADCEQALRLMPNMAQAHVNRGIILKALGRLDEALKSYNRALALAPQSAEARYNRAGLLKDLGRLSEALGEYDRALKIAPNMTAALNNRGNVLDVLGRPEEARSSFAAVLAVNPADVAALCGLCKVLCELDRLPQALAAGDRAVRLAPNLAEAYNNRGMAKQRLNLAEEALADFDRALSLEPDLVGAYGNRAGALFDLKRYDEALAAARRATEMDPNSAQAHNTLGSILRELLRLGEARPSYERALALEPDHALANWNLALLDLLTGNFARGWQGFEWRWKGPDLRRAVRSFAQPVWAGEPIAGKTILLYAEQGFGDTVQFCRYVPLVAAMGAKVVLQVPKPLVSLLSTLAGDPVLIAEGEAPPAFDIHLPLMSLPKVFATDLANIPADVPYLFADPIKCEAWVRRLGPKTGPRVGLVWSGQAGRAPDRLRSVVLERLAPILDLPFEFHCLQKEIRPADAPACVRFAALKTHTDELADFADTAALIAQMDLVISVDTAVAHVAGALGRPLWLMLSFASEWRWLLARTDTPWYPTATLMRQPALGDWDGVLAQILTRLQRHFG